MQKTAKFPQLQFHVGPRQFLNKVVFMPVACRQCWGPDVQKTVVFRSCNSSWVRGSSWTRLSSCPLRADIWGLQFWTRWTCPLLRRQVHEVQFLDKVDMPVVATTGTVLVPFVPELSASFLEPSMAKSSSLSRAPLANIRQQR